MTGVFYVPLQESAHKVDSGEENSPAVLLTTSVITVVNIGMVTPLHASDPSEINPSV